MNSEARVMPMSPATRTEEKRRGRKPSEAERQAALWFFFFSAKADEQTSKIVLKEKFGSAKAARWSKRSSATNHTIASKCGGPAP